ncbi:DUF3152 domain-containing protein [Streptomyces sp. NRRL F-5126]|uniref:DUF3152 domain-containing protein n=1 Tax=Streptomyces sp. NRRL F-5126 TaxID=1463857 RepID=UPI0004C827FD|nr:DUF3152 domain-containing protein [Streptomyces sp. NRRL F-5126]
MTRRRGSSHRRAPGRRRPLLGALAAVVLVGGASLLVNGVRTDTSSGSPRPGGRTHIAASGPNAPASSPAPHSPSPSPTDTRIKVPATGPGTFETARASGAKVGHGAKLLRYKVEVEDGVDVSPTQAANEIADILAAPRGWTANGTSSFELVSSPPFDLVVKIATPGTTDALCWAGIHQDTEGEYDCEVPGGVVVNLKRWVEGSPTFDGPIHDYRALIINHEMGHFLGFQHQTCPGKGRLAPVMMQQIKGLHGCVANAWPYDKSGHFVSGPPAG